MQQHQLTRAAGESGFLISNHQTLASSIYVTATEIMSKVLVAMAMQSKQGKSFESGASHVKFHGGQIKQG